MATNPLSYKEYFPQHTGRENQANEIDLYDRIGGEIHAIRGIPVDYFPVGYDETRDLIFKEDVNKTYFRKFVLTATFENDELPEPLKYDLFEEEHDPAFDMFMHATTFRSVVGREPFPQDQFFLPNNSTLVYEVNHVTYATLGQEGNVFGQVNYYKLTCLPRRVTVLSEGYGPERYSVLDDEGELFPDAPSDALNPDGTVKSKYKVAEPKVSPRRMDDNEFVSDITDGVFNPEAGVRENRFTVPRDRRHWADW